jgi:hypothetical protein
MAGLLLCQCLSFTALRVAVFNSDSPVSEGRQLNTTSPVLGSNSSNPDSMRGTKLSMYVTSRLRHAAFLGLRSDKSAREVRRE